MSPWSDLTLSGGSVKALKKRDKNISACSLRKAAKAYTAGVPLNDPAVSPLFADYKNFCPALIQVGSEEILLDDSVRLFEKMYADDSSAILHIYEGQQHGFQIYPSLSANNALAEVDDFIKDLSKKEGDLYANRKN
jgi:acetyl esterase/lipase